MALSHIAFKSAALGMETHCNVILPEKSQYPEAQPRREFPVLYLLHGLSDDYATWQRRTNIEEYTRYMDLVVVMPDAGRSFYTNTLSGGKYLDYIAKELPAFCRANLPISGKREDTFAAGLSMGGYGAFKLGLTFPERYGAVASLSGVLDLASTIFGSGDACRPGSEFYYVFGDTVKDTANDLFFLANRALHSDAPRPRFYQCCGTEDFLYEGNCRFRDRFSEALNITYEEGPGVHGWAFWDQYIQHVLSWLAHKEE